MALEREVKVGLLLLAALSVLAAGLFLIGTEEKLFVRKNLYFIRFDDVGGLAPGGVVELNGVNVGKVKKVVLPENPGRPEVVVWVEIERHYARRLRAPAGPASPANPAPAPSLAPAASMAAAPSLAPVANSPTAPSPAPVPAPVPQSTKAELKTQGLLGDRYVALTLGSEQYPPIPERGEIPAATPFSVEALLASGDDLMGQVKQIVKDLKGFTGSLNSKGGLVPRLVTDQEYGREVSAKLRSTLDNLSLVTGKIASGKGTLGKLVDDPGVYNGLNDVVAGVNQNGMLRWLIQNRRKAGSAQRAQNTPRKSGEAVAGAPGRQPPNPPSQPPRR